MLVISDSLHHLVAVKSSAVLDYRTDVSRIVRPGDAKLPFILGVVGRVLHHHRFAEVFFTGLQEICSFF